MRAPRRKNTVVDFTPTLKGAFKDFTPRQMAHGVSILSTPEAYSGPKEFDLLARGLVAIGEFHESISRRFRILRLEDSPTGATGGSFKIDEMLAGDKIISLGFNYSFPTYDVCVRIASMSRAIERISRHSIARRTVHTV